MTGIDTFVKVISVCYDNSSLKFMTSLEDGD